MATLAELAQLRIEATELNNAGHHGAAGARYRTLLRTLDRDERHEPGSAAQNAERTALRVRAMIGLSFTLLTAARFTQAMTVLDQAEQVAGTDGELRSLVHRQRGVSLANSGRIEESLAQFDAAAAYWTGLGRHDRIVLLMNRALTHGHLGHVRAAAADSAAALDLLDPRLYPAEYFMVTYNQGMLAYLAGDLAGALATMSRADAMDVPVTRAPGLADQASVLLDAGLAGEALDMVRGIVTEAQDRGQALFAAQLHTIAARALLLLGRPDEAYAVAVAARRQLTAARGRQPVHAADLMVLSARLARGEPARPIALAADRLVARCTASRSASLIGARLLAAQAWLGVDVRRAEAAVAGLRPAQILTLSERLQLRQVQASAALAQHEPTRARRVLRAAAADLRACQQQVASQDIAMARARHTVPLVEMDLTMALRSGPAATFAAAERWRWATTPLGAVRPPQNARDAELLAVLRGLHARLDAAPPGIRRDLTAQIRRVESQLRQRNWTERSGDGPPATPVPTYADALAALRAQERVAVNLITCGDRIYALVLGHGPGRVVPLMPARQAAELMHRVLASVRVSVTSARGNEHAGLARALAADLAELDDGLIGPLSLPERPLVIVPTRTVIGMPWGLLPRLHARPFTVAASMPQALRAAAPLGADGQVAILGGPGLAGLPDEAAAIAQAWRGRARLRVDPAATGASVRAALRDAALVHISAHGHHEATAPLFSRLDLGDGPLFAHELEASGVGAARVVLCACEIGSSTSGPGEGSTGFAATLLTLGAVCVIAAVTQIPDELATRVAAGLHRRLATGMPSDQALAATITECGAMAGSFLAFGASC